MIIYLLAVVFGFGLLVWSADRFVDGAAATSRHAGMPNLLIGMVVVGFGTSAPEMVVSAIAAYDDSPSLALGNALGSNIVNTGLILGVTALFYPLLVHSKIVRKELPILIAISLLVGALLWDNAIERWEAVILLVGFFGLVGWSIYSGLKGNGDALQAEFDQEAESFSMPLPKAITWLVVGLVLLVVSSRIVVWGAVSVAEAMGISDLIIGLTIVALGTSLPELAATVMAARKGEHDIAIGNVVGSNMFNLLAVVGIAGVITPMEPIATEVLTRDWPAMLILTVALLVFAFGFKGQGKINRWEGAGLLAMFITYNTYLIISTMPAVSA